MSWSEEVSAAMLGPADEHGKLLIAFGARTPEEVNDPRTRAFMDAVWKLWDEMGWPNGLLIAKGHMARITHSE
jgi:hypothetical protein